MGQLKLAFAFFIFVTDKTFKTWSKRLSYFTKKAPFVLNIFRIVVLYSSPLFSFLGYCWFYGRSSMLKFNGINMSLNWIPDLETWSIDIESITWRKFSWKNLVSPKVNLGLPYWHVGSLAYWMLFTALYFIWNKGPRETWNEVGSQSLAKYIISDQTLNL